MIKPPVHSCLSFPTRKAWPFLSPQLTKLRYQFLHKKRQFAAIISSLIFDGAVIGVALSDNSIVLFTLWRCYCEWVLWDPARRPPLGTLTATWRISLSGPSYQLLASSAWELASLQHMGSPAFWPVPKPLKIWAMAWQVRHPLAADPSSMHRCAVVQTHPSPSGHLLHAFKYQLASQSDRLGRYQGY